MPETPSVESPAAAAATVVQRALAKRRPPKAKVEPAAKGVSMNEGKGEVAGKVKAPPPTARPASARKRPKPTDR